MSSLVRFLSRRLGHIVYTDSKSFFAFLRSEAMVQFIRDGLARARLQRWSRPQVHLRTSSLAYHLWWTGLLLLHCVNLGYYTGVAMLYNTIEQSVLYFQLQNYAIGISNTDYPKVVGIHAAIAAIHAACIAAMVVSSIRARKLVFQPDLRPLFACFGRWWTRIVPWRASSTSVTRLANSSNDTGQRGSGWTESSMSRHASSSLSKVFARDGLLGVDSVYFDHVLLVRELVETSLQTYQLYRMTLLLPRLWLIRFYMALLVGNCWSVPVLHRLYRHNESKRRLLCLLCDAVLDMLSSIGVSLIIFRAYAQQYPFPFTAWFDDKWLANMQHEFEMMVVASWGDMVSRIVFALGLLRSMYDIKEMLAPSVLIRSTDSKIGPSRGSVDAIAQDGSHQDDVRAATSSLTVVAVWRRRGRVAIKVLVEYVGPGLFVVWGIAILVIHLMADSHHATEACELTLKPWFSSKPGCSLVELNCHVLQSTGQDQAITKAWDLLDPPRAARVVIRHCPELVISSKLQLFSNTVGFKVYNSTVIAWGDDGALTARHHGSLRSVTLVRTFLPNGELPRGLLSPTFPPLLTMMATCVTNIQRLPSDLDTIWHPGSIVLFEYSQLTSISEPLLRLNPYTISLAGSPITHVPAEVFQGSNLRSLLLGLSRVQELPKNVTYLSKGLNVLFLQNTNVTTFWKWMDPFIAYTMQFPFQLFNAYNTPYCRELLAIEAGNRSGFSVGYTSEMARIMDVSSPDKLAFAKAAVDCLPGLSTSFPLVYEDGMNSLR